MGQCLSHAHGHALTDIERLDGTANRRGDGHDIANPSGPDDIVDQAGWHAEQDKPLPRGRFERRVMGLFDGEVFGLSAAP